MRVEATERPLLTIAESLVEMAKQLSRQAALDAEAAPPPSPPPAPVPGAAATRILALRRLRKKFLPEALFHEPAWEILLVLYVDAAPALSLKELSFRVDAPFTTTQRWVDHMVRIGLIQRAAAQDDRRRVDLSLTPTCADRLDAFFGAAETM